MISDYREEIEKLRLKLLDAKKNERHRTYSESMYWFRQYKLLAQEAIELLIKASQ